MLCVKESSNATLQIGPFLDSTDADTEETGLSIANTDILLAKQGSTSWGSKNSGGATHQSNGMYSITLNSTDTSVVGRLQLICHKTGALYVKQDIHVIPSLVWDALFVGTDALEVDVTQIAGNTTAGTILYRILSGCVIAQAVTGTLSADEFTTNINASDYPGATTDNFFNGKNFVFVTGNLRGQGGPINDYVGASKKIVCDTLSGTPANNDYFVIY